MDRREFDAARDSLSKMAATQQEVEKGLDRYIEKIKELGKLNQIIADHQKSMADVDADILDLTTKIADERSKLAASFAAGLPLDLTHLNNLKKERKLRKETSKTMANQLRYLEAMRLETARGINEANKMTSAYNSAGKVFSRLPSMARTFLNTIRGLEAVGMSKEIKKSQLSMGILTSQSRSFYKNMSNASKSTNILGVGVSDIAQMQAEYSESIGRSIQLTGGDFNALSEVAKGTSLGVKGAAEMAIEMDNFGVSATVARDRIEESVELSHKMGVNTTKALKELTKNLKVAQRFRFKGGVKDMVEMAALSAKIGINIESISSIADKVFRPEGAVEMAAMLQTMGGNFAKIGDPFQLMFKARNDIKGFTQDIAKAAGELAQWNPDTKEFDISGLQLDRMRELSQILGISVDELSIMGKNMAKFNQIESLVPNTFNKEDKDLISSLAYFDDKSNQWRIHIDGKDQFIKDLDKTQINRYKKEKETLKDQARNAQTFDDAINNLTLQFKTTLLPFVEALNSYLVKPLQGLQERMDKEGWIDGIKSFAEKVGNLVGVVGKFIIDNPITTLVGYLGGSAFFNFGKWYSNGMALAAGFNSAASLKGGGMGMSDSFFDKSLLGTGTKSKMVRGLLPKIGKTGTRMAIGGAKLLSGGASFGGGILGGYLGGLGSEAMGNTDNTSGDISSIVGGLALGALGTFLGGPAGTIAGAALGSAIGKMAGDYFGDYGGPKTSYQVNDGIIKFNPHDKIISTDDAMVASTQKGKLDELIGGNKSTSPTEIKMSFDPIKIMGSIDLTGLGQNISIDLTDDPIFIREMTKLIQEQLRINLSGGKLNPSRL